MAFVALLVVWAISFVVGAILRAAVRPPQAKPGEIEAPQAEEGSQIPAIFGTVKIAANTLWFGDVLEEPIKEARRVYGLVGPKDTIGYRYHVGMQGGLCWGPVDALVDIIIADKYNLSTFGATTTRTYNEETGLYDETTAEVIAPPVPQPTSASGLLFTIEDADMFGGKEREGGIVGPLRFYWGTSAQGANAYLQTQTGIDPFPAYQGLCYAVWEQVYLGTSPYIKPWQFVLRRCPTALGTLAGNTALSRIGDDANPAEVLYELWTDSRWGLGRPSTDLDTDSFLAALQTLSDEGLGISGTMLGATKAEDKVKEILGTIDGVMVPDPVSGLLRLTLIREDYVVDDLETFTASVMRDLTYSRPEPAELTSEVKVRYTDASQNFTTRVRPAYNPALFQVATRSTPLVVDYPLITTGANADRLALRDLKAVSSTLAIGSCTVTRGASHLAPGDPFIINDPDQGLENVVVRVTRANYGTPHGEDWVELQWTEDVFGVTSGTFTTDPTETFTPPPPTNVGQRFEVETELTISDTQGCLTLRITGDVSSITLVETRTQQGGEAAGDWTAQDNSAPITVCVDRDDIDTGHIAYRITYTGADGDPDTIEDDFDVPPLGADDGNAEGTPGNWVLTMRAGPPLELEEVPAALTEPAAAATDRIWLSLKKVEALFAQIGNGRALAGGEFALMYSLTGAGGSFVDLGPFVELDAVRYPAVGDIYALAVDHPARAADRVCLSWGVRGGDGTSSSIARITNIYVVATSADAATTPPAPDPPTEQDPPIGGSLGPLLMDLDSRVVGTPDEDGFINQIFDQSGNSNDAATGLGCLYEPDGLGTGIPCWSSNNLAQMVVAEQPTQSDLTYYIVAKVLGTASIPGGVGQGPILFANAGPGNIAVGAWDTGQVYAYVWTSIWGNTVIISDDPVLDFLSPSTGIIRLTFNKTLGHFAFHINGALVPAHYVAVGNPPTATGMSESDCNPQFLDPNVPLRIGGQDETYWVDAKFGRVLCYGAAHTDVSAEIVESLLRDQWGIV